MKSKPDFAWINLSNSKPQEDTMVKARYFAGGAIHILKRSGSLWFNREGEQTDEPLQWQVTL